MTKEIEETHVKSKERVTDHGEVFSNKHKEIGMLVFLASACGTGNFYGYTIF